MSRHIKTHVKTDGFEGILYPGDGRRDKVMIVMSGSDGGLTLTKQEAAFYDKTASPPWRWPCSKRRRRRRSSPACRWSTWSGRSDG